MISRLKVFYSGVQTKKYELGRVGSMYGVDTHVWWRKLKKTDLLEEPSIIIQKFYVYMTVHRNKLKPKDAIISKFILVRNSTFRGTARNM
jgi:hypothetical protein